MTTDTEEKLAKVLANGYCSRCKVGISEDDHTCPFAKEIHDDYVTLCDCCENCEHECAMDI